MLFSVLQSGGGNQGKYGPSWFSHARVLPTETPGGESKKAFNYNNYLSALITRFGVPQGIAFSFHPWLDIF